MRRTLGRWPDWKRRLVYADPRDYWTLRGGDDYFREQEGQPARDRAARVAGRPDRVATGPTSILEVGCGYGKQLRALRGTLDVPMVGVDFSPSQLGAGAALPRRVSTGVELVLGSGARLPFPDRSFDLVLTSAVILHNPPAAGRARSAARSSASAAASRRTTRTPTSATTATATTPPPGTARRASRWPSAGRSRSRPTPSSTQFCVADAVATLTRAAGPPPGSPHRSRPNAASGPRQPDRRRSAARSSARSARSPRWRCAGGSTRPGWASTRACGSTSTTRTARAWASAWAPCRRSRSCARRAARTRPQRVADIAYTTNTLTCLRLRRRAGRLGLAPRPARWRPTRWPPSGRWGLVAVAGLTLLKRYESFLDRRPARPRGIRR